MTILELYKALDARYPRTLSCPWDNDGLMVCPNETADVKRVLVALDITKKTLAHAAENGSKKSRTTTDRTPKPAAQPESGGMTKQEFINAMNSVNDMTTDEAAALITAAANDGIISREEQLDYMMIYG